MAKIVISYRRADTEAITGRIRDRLAGYYGEESVYMDIDSIPFGLDYRQHIRDALDHTDALIAVIGPGWRGATDTGDRIQDETDLVRIEVETALQRGIPVVPVLVDDATMPKPDELPDGLKDLAFRNAAQIDSGRDFHLHMDRLLRSLDKVLAANAPAGASPAVPPTTATAVESDARPVQATERAAGERASSAGATPPAAPDHTAGPVPPVGRRNVLVLTLAGAGVVVAAAAAFYLRPLMLPTEAPPRPDTEIKVVAPPPAGPTDPAVPPAPPGTRCSFTTAVAFRDDFAPADPGWGDTAATRFFADGSMVFKRTEPGWTTWLYRPLRFKNASVCATVKAPPQANRLDGKASSGIVFWAADLSSYYLAQIYLDGSYQVFRRLANEWIPVVARARSEHVNPGTSAINQIQVMTKDSTATLFVNGKKVVEFRGQPPAAGGAVGLHAETEADRVEEWRFLDIAVQDPDQPAAKPPSAKAMRAATTAIACQADPGAAFADDFKAPDAGWGSTSNTGYYAGGQLVLKPNANKTRSMLYLSLRFANATVCANVKSPPGPVAADEIASAGIAFWAANYRNFYTVTIFRDGSYDLYRKLDDEWIRVAKRTPAESIRPGGDAANQIKLYLVDNRGTLYINNVKLLDFWGQPPRIGGAVGLFAQSDKTREVEWRFQNIVVVD